MENQRFFGNWKIVSHLGSGSFGDVYKIKKEEFGVEYYSAMKVIHIPQDKGEKSRLYSEGMGNNDIREYYSQIVKDFIKEIELMASLQGNTNIVGYNDHIIEENKDGVGYTIYIRMEYLTPLDHFLSFDNKARFMTKSAVIKLGIDICNALELCEKKHIIHRDIKPGNIFVSQTGDYKLGDFGIARKLEKTQSGLSRKGTLDYMAPEVYRGESYDHAVDIYSLGIVLYRLLNCNRVPFAPLYPNPIKYTDSEKAFQRRMKGERIPYIKSVEPELNKVVIKACEFNKNKRYKNATELKNALMNVQRLISFSESSGRNTNSTVILPNRPANLNNRTEFGGSWKRVDKPAPPVLQNVSHTASQSSLRTNSAAVVNDDERKKKIIIIVASVAVVIISCVIVGTTLNASLKAKRRAEISASLASTTAITTETTTETTTQTTTKKPAATKKQTTTKKKAAAKKKSTTKKQTTTYRYTTKRQTTAYNPPKKNTSPQYSYDEDY